jgi:hypothetical protein
LTAGGRPAAPIRPSALQISDEELLSGLRSCESGSQAELYRRYARRVAALIRRVLGKDAELRALVQDTSAQALSVEPNGGERPERTSVIRQRHPLKRARGYRSDPRSVVATPDAP